MASKGYPESYKSGYTIKGIEKVTGNNIVFHAGTKLKKNKLSYTWIRRIFSKRSRRLSQA